MIGDIITAVRFERVSESDQKAFYELRRSAIRAGCARHYDASLLEAWTDESSDSEFQRPLPEHFYFARIGDLNVACGVLDIGTGRIDAMFVSPAYLGRGVGKSMLKHLIRSAKEHGVEELSLHATLNAVEFYRSQGFRGDEVGTYQSPRGVTVSCVPMRMYFDQPLQGLSQR